MVRLHNVFLPLCALALSAGFASIGSAQELVVNGGFETGNTTGWSFGGGNSVTTSSNFVHSGSFGVSYGAVGATSPISQTLATTPGDVETITFWQHQLAGTPNEFKAQFGGVTLVDDVNLPLRGWFEYTFTQIATSSSTVIEFDMRQDPAFSALDDVSVIQSVGNATPEPGLGSLLAVMAVSGGALLRRRRTR